MIRLQLTDWEIMVLRAALETHIKNAPTDKHREAAQSILRKSRASDNPAKALAKLAARP